jgi:hypothetical protein
MVMTRNVNEPASETSTPAASSSIKSVLAHSRAPPNDRAPKQLIEVPLDLRRLLQLEQVRKVELLALLHRPLYATSQVAPDQMRSLLPRQVLHLSMYGQL